jgi:steroid delta-isomerase-like uncharacterized protein
MSLPLARAARTAPDALVAAYYSALTDNRLDDLNTLPSEDFEEHELLPGIPPNGAGLKQKYSLPRSGFSDLRFGVEDLLANGDRVAVRVTVGGTHNGVFPGRPPTGRTFEVTSVSIFRSADGRIAEHWGVFDQMAMLGQLGALGPS